METSGRIHSGFRSIEVRPAAASPLQSPETQEKILEEELLIRQDSPHPVRAKRILPLRFLFSLVQSIARLISQVCGKAPPHITQGLYEEILLGSSNKKIIGSKESALLEFLSNFFKKSPHLEKESILKELSQAAVWAKKIETCSVLFADKTFKAVAKEIAEQVGKLKNGESCILPGGALATFRITKEGDTFRLEVFSRHPDFPGLEWVEAGGKKKVRGCLLQGIPLDSLSNPSWIEGFLRTAQEGKPESYNKVLSPFTSFLVPSKDANLPFHASKEGLCRIQNIWDLVHRGESGKRTLHRRKISLQLEALYGFFQQQKSDLHTDSVAYLYLKKGVEKVARTALAIGDDLTPEEKEKIQNDLYTIDTYLKNLIPQPSTRSIPTSPKNSPLSLAFPCIKTRSPSISSDPVHLFANAVPLSGSYASKNHSYELAPTPDLSSREKCIDALKKLQQKMQDKQLSSTEKLLELVQMGLLLPLPSSSLERESIQGKLPVNAWQHEEITREDMWYGWVDDVQAKKDAEETAALLTKLSAQLYTLLQQRPNIAPRHFLALTKYAALTGKLTKYFGEQGIIKEFPDLLALIQDLYYGSNLGGRDVLGLRRSSLSHSIYLCQTETEQAALEQLKNYSSPSSPYAPKASDSSWRTGEDYIHPVGQEWSDPLHPGRGIKPGPIALGLASQLKNLLELVKAEPYRNTPNAKDILRFVLQPGKKMAPPSLGHVSHEWLQPFQNPLLMAIFYGFRLDKGNGGGGDNCIFTQEAIMDHPWQAVEKAFQAWQNDLPNTDPLKKQLFQEGWAKRALENLLSEEQLKELLIAMSPSNSSWNFLAFFKKHPSTLEHPAMQAILERLILQPGSLQASGKADPTFPKFLSEFFTYYLKKYQQTQKLSSYLFLHRLSRRCACLLSPLAKETVFPQQFAQIRQWKNASAQPQSPLAPFRQQLLSEFLEMVGSQTELSDALISEYLVASAEIQSVSSAKGLSPAEQDLLQQQYCSWLPQSKEALQKDEALLRHTLDKICALRGISLPKGMCGQVHFQSIEQGIGKSIFPLYGWCL